MRKLFLFVSLIGLLQACDTNLINNPGSETSYSPILMSRIDLEKSIGYMTPIPISNPGKIYYKMPYIFINEAYRGVHVYNNIDPTNPVNLGFIRIPGNNDISIKGNILYADNATDLVAIDITDVEHPVVKQRIKNTFNEFLPPDADFIPTAFNKENRQENTVIIGWEFKQ